MKIIKLMINHIINKITNKIKIDKITIPYLSTINTYLTKHLTRLHIYLIKKSRLYYRLQKNRYIRKSKAKLSLTFALILITAIVISPFSNVQAASYTKTWTSQGDFTTNVTGTNADTSSVPGSVKMAQTSTSQTQNTTALFNTGTKSNTAVGTNNVFLLKPIGATAASATECASNYISGGLCANPWITGITATAMAGKYVYLRNLASTDKYTNGNAIGTTTPSWKTTQTSCVGPQCVVGLDPNYSSNMVLVADNTVDFALGTSPPTYPARDACKAVGGRLPNMQELIAIYAGKASYGNNFLSNGYWSATENNNLYANVKFFSNGGNGIDSKTLTTTYHVRCVKDTIAPDSYPNSGTFTSGIIDMTRSVAFSSLVWTNTIPASTSIAMQFRSGPTGHPTVDGSWTAWSSTMTTSGSSIAGSSGQYAQYQATLGSSNINNVPILSSVIIYANTTTLSGTGFQTNAGGEAIWTNLSWNASDVPTGDIVKFNTRTSNDGSTWSDWGSDIAGVAGANSVDLSVPDSQYLDIKVTLNGDVATPTLDDFTLSYTINGPPVVSNPTASRPIQGRMGLVNFGYTVSDPDNDNATIYAFYGTGITQTGTFSSSDTTLNVNNTDNTPNSGTISLDDEMITYTGKTTTSFTGLTRAALNTKAVSHTASTAVYTKCVTTTGTGTQSSGSLGSNHSGTWNAPVDLPDVNLTNVTMKIIANDGQLARMISSAVTTGFDLDTRNSIPVVNNVNASQPIDGSLHPISIAYTASDVDDTTANISFFYNPDSYVQTGNFSDTATTLNVSGTAGMANSGTLLVNNEMMTYTGKTSTSFTGITRGTNNTIAVAHSAGASVSAKCTTITNDGLQNSGAGNTYIGVWDVATDMPGEYFSGAVMTVVANDGQPTRNVGLATSSSFIIDTKTPVLGSTPIRFNVGSRTNVLANTLTLDASDGSPLSMMLSQNSNFDQATWADYYPSTVVNLNSGADGDRTVYAKFKDSYGNTSTVESATINLDTVSTKPTGTMLIDGSIVDLSNYQILLSWVPVTDTDFSSYSIERSVNNDIFSLLATFNNKQTNAYADRMLSQGSTYYYRLRSSDDLGNTSAYTDALSMAPAGVDQTPPQITGPDPSVSPSAIEATISWLTNEASDSFVEYGTTTDYGSTQGKIDSLSIHEVNLVGLNPETDYHFRVRSRDAAGNDVVSTDFNFKTTAIEEKTTTPTISGATAQKAGADPEEVTIVWTTDKATTSQVKYGTDANNLDSLTTKDKALNTAHYVHITKLKPNTKYYYQVISTDKYGNQKIDETKYFVTSQTGIGSPKISAVETTDVTLNSAIISWETTVVATSVIEYGTDNSYGSRIEDQSLGSTTKHLIRLKNLKEGAKYHYRVHGLSTTGVQVSSDDYVFTSLTKPTISNIQIKDINSTKAVVTWRTDTESDSFVDFGTDKTDSSQGRSEEVKDHAVTISGLKSATTYTVKLKSRDKYGNQAVSDIRTFKTIIDTSAPIIKDLKSETSIITDSNGDSKAQAIISWSTDEPATSQVKYAAGVTTNGNYTSSVPEEPALTTSHIVIISNLKPSSTYHMKIVSKDASGNMGVSDDYTVLTQSQEKSLFQYIIQILEKKFEWINGFKII